MLFFTWISFLAFLPQPRFSSELFFGSNKNSFVCLCVRVCNTFHTSGNSWNLIRNKTQDECIKTSRCFLEIHSCCCFYVRCDFTDLCMFCHGCVATQSDRVVIVLLLFYRWFSRTMRYNLLGMFDEQVFPRSEKKPNDKIHLLECLAKHFMWNCGWNKILSNGFHSHSVNTH